MNPAIVLGVFTSVLAPHKVEDKPFRPLPPATGFLKRKSVHLVAMGLAVACSTVSFGQDQSAQAAAAIKKLPPSPKYILESKDLLTLPEGGALSNVSVSPNHVLYCIDQYGVPTLFWDQHKVEHPPSRDPRYPGFAEMSPDGQHYMCSGGKGYLDDAPMDAVPVEDIPKKFLVWDVNGPLARSLELEDDQPLYERLENALGDHGFDAAINEFFERKHSKTHSMHASLKALYVGGLGKDWGVLLSFRPAYEHKPLRRYVTSWGQNGDIGGDQVHFVVGPNHKFVYVEGTKLVDSEGRSFDLQTRVPQISWTLGGQYAYATQRGNGTVVNLNGEEHFLEDVTATSGMGSKVALGPAWPHYALQASMRHIADAMPSSGFVIDSKFQKDSNDMEGWDFSHPLDAFLFWKPDGGPLVFHPGEGYRSSIGASVEYLGEGSESRLSPYFVDAQGHRQEIHAFTMGAVMPMDEGRYGYVSIKNALFGVDPATGNVTKLGELPGDVVPCQWFGWEADAQTRFLCLTHGKLVLCTIRRK